MSYPLQQTVTAEAPETPCIETSKLSAYYKSKQALHDVSITIPENKVTAFIGPSGCGKSTLLRSFNRLNDLVDGFRLDGNISIHGQNIYSPDVYVPELRSRVGMVFQKPNPFPASIVDNIAYGLRLKGIRKSTMIHEMVEWALRSVYLWDEVKDRLNDNALSLSGGQQQRLIIARAIVMQPKVLLLDEPASALDPIATFKLEQLIQNLKDQYTVVIVTHNMQQAGRVSDYTAFMYMGKLIEYDLTATLFTNPKERLTEDYITGAYG